MPTLRLARAPKRKPTATAIAIPSRTPHQGFQPRFRPLVLPFVVALPTTNPAMPYTATWASETMPANAERKIRLAATMPRNSICVSSAPTQ